MFINEQTSRTEALLSVARHMMTAARTAPKACGIDNLEIAMVTGADIETLAAKMHELGIQPKRSFFLRDAENICNSEAVVLIGTHLRTQGLDCGLCGFPSCSAKQTANESIPCIFNTNDLGLAIGSAVSVAADNRVDNRVMYSVGVAARELGLLTDCPIIMAIPIACMGKSPFFDRKTALCAK